MSKENEDDVKDAVGNYIIEQILKDCSQQKSAVSGNNWAPLSKDYKDIKKKTSGKAVANLELFGDMLDALEFKPTKDGIEVGIFDKDQAMKADNHNHFGVFGKATLPKRQFIPKENESFRKGILSEVKKIIDDTEKQ